MTTLYLVRHGETIDNVNQIMQGQTQGQLTATGQEQARRLCDSMAGKALDAVVASDLKRAVDTASVIARQRCLPVVTTQLLRERDWGSFTGRYIPSLKGEAWPADIETQEQLRQRAADFLDYIRRHYPGCRVLAVGHGIINKAVQAVYHGLPMSEIERMDNAEVRVMELAD